MKEGEDFFINLDPQIRFILPDSKSCDAAAISQSSLDSFRE